MFFFFLGGGWLPHKWFLRFEIFWSWKLLGERFQTPNLDIWTCFFESDGWFDCKVTWFDPAVLTGTFLTWKQCSQRKSYLLLLRRFWKMLGIYKCHCCNCPTLSYHVISTFHRLIDLSIPHSKPTHQKQSEPYIGYMQLAQPFLPKITLNIFLLGG